MSTVRPASRGAADRLGLGAPGGHVVRAARQGRGLIQAAEVVRGPPHGGEGAGGGVGVREGGDARLVEDRLARRDARTSHPARQDGLPLDPGVGLELFGGPGRVGHRLGREDDEQAVAVRVVRGDLEGLGVAVGVGVAEDVDRVAVAPGAGQGPVERGERLGRQLGQRAAALDQGVGGEDGGAAGVGDDRQVRAPRARLLGEDLGQVEDVGDRVDAEDAAAAEGGVEDLVTAGERAGVRGRRLGRRLGPPGLDHDDRLGQRHLARRREELAARRRSTPYR